MKIKRANFVNYAWKNCLNPEFHPLDARNEGWEVRETNGVKYLVPIWYTGNNLLTDEEYNEHIMRKYKNIEDDQMSDLENTVSESESSSDDYAESESTSTDEEEDATDED